MHELAGGLSCPAEPFCVALLSEPASVLTDPERWPAHFPCLPTLRHSCALWSSRLLGFLGTEPGSPLVRWAFQHPLPLGRREIARFAQTRGDDPGLVGLAERSARLGLPDDLRAAMILTPVLPDGERVELIFSCRQRSRRRGGRIIAAYEIAGELLAFVPPGLGLRPAVAELIEAARAWWAPFVGQVFSPGRPPGTGVFRDAEDCRRALSTAIRRLAETYGRAPTEEEAAGWITEHVLPRRYRDNPKRKALATCTGQQIREWIGRRGFALGTWEELVRQALGEH